jgi:hypothetical protein
MQFRLRTLLVVFVILWSSLAACGPAGIVVTIGVVAIATAIYAFSKPAVMVSLVVISVTLVLVALVLLVVECSRISSREVCRSHLHYIALGLRAYHERYNSFPPAYVADKTGKPIHSWRVLLLPSLGEGFLYDQYDFGQPWNSPTNAAVSWGGKHLLCPSDRNWNGASMASVATSYFAVVGPQTAWKGSRPAKLSDLPEGGRRMILLVESADPAINWKEPKDLTYEEASVGINRQGRLCISSSHTEGGDYFHHARRGAFAAFVDGSIHFLPEDISPDDLRALLTGDTSRTIDLESALHPPLNWSHIVGLAVLVASCLLLIIGAIVQRLRRPAKTEPNEDQ